MRYTLYILLSLLACATPARAQHVYELNKDWQCIKASSVNRTGQEPSLPGKPLHGWMPAVVPGTVLTTLLYNKQIPDPFYGMNNKQIPDIYDAGKELYTYWFVNDIREKAAAGEHIWLQFRGVNYSCDAYLNGHHLNDKPEKGMYLRREYDITPFLAKDDNNRLAVIVYPPYPVGNPNGGQGGDGMIAHSLTNQFVAGWDWIQPIRDRNTGIWDKVFIKRTKQVTVSNTHIVTLVPGRRVPGEPQAPATLKVSAEVANADAQHTVKGTLQYELEGRKASVKVALAPGEKKVVPFPDKEVTNPRLWWPNGYGKQELYQLKVQFVTDDNAVSDAAQVAFGIRELRYPWNAYTQSREIQVNGQRIFIKGGNWIMTDALLRFSKERYDAEVRYHRDMDLNMIRVWGGGITERPEFYDACDKYGLLVFQDLWVSGDCNGRWYDPFKLEDTNARRNYPDDHQLFLTAAADQVKMLRDHPSLAIWCGGNEIRPPADILGPLRDSLLPQLDGTRIFFEYSNHDSMSYHAYDGPYTIQRDNYFWEHRSFAFNSEIGSVGIGDRESLERFIPAKDMVPPYYDTVHRKWVADTVWQYHKYSSYDSAIELYGHPKDMDDLLRKAQLVNYSQYRSLMESFVARMWRWYTGVLVWKTQNPWTAMVGQMYDVYLDPNACLYGLGEGSKPLHILYDPVDSDVLVANNGFTATGSMSMTIAAYDLQGKKEVLRTKDVVVLSDTCIALHHLKAIPRSAVFLCLTLTDTKGKILDENIYWLPDDKGRHAQLENMPVANISVAAKYTGKGKITISIFAPEGGPVAFFNRISVVGRKTRKRILPAFCNNNYISVPPGAERTVQLEFDPVPGASADICIEGWNTGKRYIEPKH